MKIILIITILSLGLFYEAPKEAYAVTEELFSITYPQGSEQFTTGQQVTITWQTTGNVPQVYLAILGYDSTNPDSVDDTCSYINLTSVPVLNNGSFLWSVDVNHVNAGSTVNCKYYKAAVYKAPDFATMDASPGFFTVTGSTTTTPPPITTPTVPVGAHDAGTNVRGTDGTIYRIETGGYRSPYTSAGAFLSYKFNTWGTVVNANATDMTLPLTTYTPTGATTSKTYFIPPKNGSLIVDKGTVYLIVNGLRAGFTSETVFKELGYTFKQVFPGDTSFMDSQPNISDAKQKHPDGSLIIDNGTLYVMKYGTRVGFPSMAILESWGIWLNDAVPANEYDKATPVGEVLRMRMVNQLNI